MNKCLDDSLQPIKDARDYIVNAKLRSCIYPTPEGHAQYRSAARYFMMLREYWMLCQKLLLTEPVIMWPGTHTHCQQL